MAAASLGTRSPSAPVCDSSMLGRSAVVTAAAAIHATAIGQRSATTARPNQAVIARRGPAGPPLALVFAAAS